MESRNEILGKLNSLRAEASSLKRELRGISARRQQLYDESGKLWEEFKPLIARIKELRMRRDSHTSEVKGLKSQRQEASSQARGVAGELRKLREEKERKIRQLGIKKSAGSIEAEIRKLEYRIETGAIPFEQEQRLNKIIRALKADLKRSSQLTELAERLSESSKTLRSSKSVSDSAHKELQLHASVSQKLHEEMLQGARKADEIKAKLRPLEAEKEELRQRHARAKEQLERKTEELNEVSGKLHLMLEEEQKKKRDEEQKMLEIKENELAEKIKAGKKLTMDDLIKLQRV